MIIKFLLWLGFVKHGRKSTLCRINPETGTLEYVYPVTIIWPFHAPPAHMFWTHLRLGAKHGFDRIYVFRNLPGVIKWAPGRVLPRRWGIGFCGFEFGDRG
ncbi:hypothetical protein D3C87_687430 [compost metagenome]